tara:strand:- start:2095 stop:2691 length:597 start_codon:yes stop_codon:yes gene_type:complete
MSLLETYECKKCGPCSTFVERDEETGLFYYDRKVGRKIHEDKVPKFDGTEDYYYSPDWNGDSAYWYKYESVYTYDYPDNIKCPTCKRKTGQRASIYYFSVGSGRNSYASLKERQRYAHEGMDKKQAEQFYKESVEASKERIKTGDQHYKKVVPNYEVLRKQGQVRRLNDQERANKIQNLKQTNQAITKDGTIGKASRK